MRSQDLGITPGLLGVRGAQRVACAEPDRRDLPEDVGSALALQVAAILGRGKIALLLIAPMAELITSPFSADAFYITAGVLLLSLDQAGLRPRTPRRV